MSELFERMPRQGFRARRPMLDDEAQFCAGRDADRICGVSPEAREQLVGERAIDAEKHCAAGGWLVVPAEAGSRISPGP
jgi:hypothetical protein